MAIREIVSAMTMAAVFTIMFFFAVAVVDPLYAVLQQYAMGGMGEQAASIHLALVKYMVPVYIGNLLIVTVFYILRSERQTVR